MILSRLATSPKRRQWKTIVLEVLNAAVCVFIRLQTDDRNERRRVLAVAYDHDAGRGRAR